MKKIIGKIKDKTFLKYVFSAGTSFLLDMALFQLFLLVFGKAFPDTYIIISTVLARILSSIYNFIINRRVVFKSGSRVSSDIIKYYALSISQMIVSSVSVHFLCMMINTYEILIKLAVDIVLFLISYQIQKKYIFKNRE